MTDANVESAQEIRSLLVGFNQAYAKRDLSALDDFMRCFTHKEQIEFIATGGMAPGRGTWRVGTEAVRDLVRADWEYWGLVQINEEKAQINTHENVAWLSAPATVITDDETEEFLGDKEETMGMVRNTSTGETRVKPLRMTATLVKEKDGWHFVQIHLSFSVRSLQV